MSQFLHLDAGESAFFLRELEHVQTRILEMPHKPIKALTLIPVNMEADPGAETVTYRTFDRLGVAKIISDYANDIPRVDIYGFEKTIKLKSLVSSFGYSVQEIRRARKANLNLESRRAATARETIDRLIDKLAWYGDAKAGIQGFLNYPGTIQYTLGTKAAGGVTFGVATVDEIIKDLTGMIAAVRTTTSGVEDIDTFVFPLSTYTQLETMRIPDTDKTLLSWLRSNFPQITRWDWANELESVNGSKQIIGFKRDLDHLDFQLPVAYEQFPPQQKGLEYEVICHARAGGVIVYRPQSVVWAAGA